MMRELLVMAKEAAPSIIFMDEIDSIGSARGGSGGGDSEVKGPMNVLNNFECVLMGGGEGRDSEHQMLSIMLNVCLGRK